MANDTVVAEGPVVHFWYTFGISTGLSFVIALILAIAGMMITVRKLTKARLRHLPREKKVKVKKGKKGKKKKGKKH